jgi:hypothetical protein
LLFKQSTGAARVALGVRMAGSPDPIETLPALGGSQVATFTDPDAGVVTFKKQPQSYSAPL